MKGQYIQFYKRSDNNRNFHMLVEDTDNVVKLDGRLSLANSCKLATEICRKNNYKGFRIMVKKDIKTPTDSYRTLHMLTDCWKVFPNSVEC